jgi:hypothetical protein
MTSSSSPQKDPRKRRLAHLAKKTSNRVCCDCPERAPTWAAIIAPPKQAPMGSRDLVAFVCSNCATAHRQLRPQVSQVKNVALDECEPLYYSYELCSYSLCQTKCPLIAYLFLGLSKSPQGRNTTWNRRSFQATNESTKFTKERSEKIKRSRTPVSNH